MQNIDYPSSDDETQRKKLKTVESAPPVHVNDLPLVAPAVGQKEIAVNATAKDLFRPLQGPANPYSVPKQIESRNVMNGFVEDHFMSDHRFNALNRTFTSKGIPFFDSFRIHPRSRCRRERLCWEY